MYSKIAQIYNFFFTYAREKRKNAGKNAQMFAYVRKMLYLCSEIHNFNLISSDGKSEV